MKIYSHKYKEEEETDVVLDEVSLYNIVLYNDDYNTFDHVIHCLIKYCKQEPEQAEQCALLVHFKGKCSVKSGEFIELIPIKEALNDQGLDAKIEEGVSK
jgi:ATP-dependent Clp protease adaptor protein ClpS